MNEQSNNVLAEEFRFFMTWGKYRDKLGLSISEHEDVRLAIDRNLGINRIHENAFGFIFFKYQ